MGELVFLLFLQIAFCSCTGWFGSYIAKERGRNTVKAFWLCFLFPLIGNLVVASLARKQGSVESTPAKILQEPAVETYVASDLEVTKKEISADVDIHKKCPDCAESILLEARRCRHCGNQFDGDSIRRTAGITIAKAPTIAARLRAFQIYESEITAAETIEFEAEVLKACVDMFASEEDPKIRAEILSTFAASSAASQLRAPLVDWVKASELRQVLSVVGPLREVLGADLMEELLKDAVVQDIPTEIEDLRVWVNAICGNNVKADASVLADGAIRLISIARLTDHYTKKVQTSELAARLLTYGPADLQRESTQAVIALHQLQRRPVDDTPLALAKRDQESIALLQRLIHGLPSKCVARELINDHLLRSSQRIKELTPKFPWVKLLVLSNFIIAGGCYFVTFGFKAVTLQDARLVSDAYKLGATTSASAADAAFLLSGKFSESWTFPKLANKRSTEWQSESQQMKFIVPAEQRLYEEVISIPAEDAEANYRGYQKLRLYQPNSALYLEKMKYYRRLYQGY